jgi:hypothetical protein
MARFLVLSSLVSLAHSTGHGQLDVNTSLAYLLRATASSRVPDADITLDCTWRRLAWQYAPTLLSARLFTEEKARRLHDALELDRLCNESFSELSSNRAREGRQRDHHGGRGAITIYVATTGDDSAAGTIDAPLLTLHAAIGVVRKHRGVAAAAPSASSAATVLLRAGTYALAEPLQLQHVDSFLTISAYNDEAVTLSGATPLDGLVWRPPTAAGAPHVAQLSAAQAALLEPMGGEMPALRVGGQRATRARFPNGNAELDLFPSGYIAEHTEWLVPVYPPYNLADSRPCDPNAPCGRPADVSIPAPAGEWHGEYAAYREGYGGSCEVYDPPRSPWCSPRFSTERPYLHTRAPSGVLVGPHLPNLPYRNATGAIVTAWRPSHWYSWMWRVKGATVGPDVNATALLFGAGGNQGGEGSDAAAEWWIENVAEELDAPNEYFYDIRSRELRLIWNHTSAGEIDRTAAPREPPSQIAVPRLTNLIELRGAAEARVSNVTLRGLTFAHTRPSYMEARGNPSGGDWALERRGAIFAEGSDGLTIEGSLFTRLDSNGVFLSGFNRRATIRDNEFEWLGQSAIASWGRLEGDTNSGLAGNQPRGTLVEGNLCREIGTVQKQSSFYFQAITAQTTLRRNVVFNIPRAAINFNDGFGGGNELTENLLFNTCRESSDHGAFNSWYRHAPRTRATRGACAEHHEMRLTCCVRTRTFPVGLCVDGQGPVALCDYRSRRLHSVDHPSLHRGAPQSHRRQLRRRRRLS